MLSRQNRLHRNRDIKRVFQKGVKTHINGLRVQVLAHNRQSLPRVTVIISTKVAKRATERNRLKRQVRALMHQFITRYPMLDSDIVITITKPQSYADFAHSWAESERALVGQSR